MRDGTEQRLQTPGSPANGLAVQLGNVLVVVWESRVHTQACERMQRASDDVVLASQLADKAAHDRARRELRGTCVAVHALLARAEGEKHLAPIWAGQLIKALAAPHKDIVPAWLGLLPRVVGLHWTSAETAVLAPLVGQTADAIAQEMAALNKAVAALSSDDLHAANGLRVATFEEIRKLERRALAAVVERTTRWRQGVSGALKLLPIQRKMAERACRELTVHWFYRELSVLREGQAIAILSEARATREHNRRTHKLVAMTASVGPQEEFLRGIWGPLVDWLYESLSRGVEAGLVLAQQGKSAGDEENDESRLQREPSCWLDPDSTSFEAIFKGRGLGQLTGTRFLPGGFMSSRAIRLAKHAGLVQKVHVLVWRIRCGTCDHAHMFVGDLTCSCVDCRAAERVLYRTPWLLQHECYPQVQITYCPGCERVLGHGETLCSHCGRSPKVDDETYVVNPGVAQAVLEPASTGGDDPCDAYERADMVVRYFLTKRRARLRSFLQRRHQGAAWLLVHCVLTEAILCEAVFRPQRMDPSWKRAWLEYYDTGLEQDDSARLCGRISNQANTLEAEMLDHARWALARAIELAVHGSVAPGLAENDAGRFVLEAATTEPKTAQAFHDVGCQLHKAAPELRKSAERMIAPTLRVWLYRIKADFREWSDRNAS